MSLYTTEVRFICEEAAGLEESKGLSDVDNILKETWDKVIPQNWPIWDEEYRSVLCQKILKHYYTREIGLETVGLWKLKLETKLNEIMPYYNELYATKLLKFDPFRDTDYYKEHEGSGAGENTRSGEYGGENGGTTWNLFSDTPQGSLTNVDQEKYLTDARKITDDRTNSSTAEEGGTYSNTDEYIDHVYGKLGNRSYMKLLKELREVIINIDVMIINELKELFFMLWR